MEYRLYEPDKYIKLGMKIWPEMVSELVRSRELIWRFFLRNWAARYKQSALGYLWAVILPFIPIATFMFLNRAGIMNIGETNVPYPLFALIGLSVWQLFSTGLNLGCVSIVSAGTMVSKIKFPLETLVFSSALQAAFEFFIKYVLIIAAFFMFGVKISWGIALFPLAVIPMLLLTAGLALVLSLVNGVLRDTANVVTLLTTFLMFLTPVLYPASTSKSMIFKINPLSPLIEGPRDIVIHGTMGDPYGFLIASAGTIVIFLMCWRVFYLAKTKIPERM